MSRHRQTADIALRIDTEKHVLRQMQGRRHAGQSPPRLVDTKSPRYPVVVEGGWKNMGRDEQRVNDNLGEMQVFFIKFFLRYQSVCFNARVTHPGSVQFKTNETG